MHIYSIQWNPSIPNTLGTCVLITGVSSFQGFLNGVVTHVHLCCACYLIIHTCTTCTCTCIRTCTCICTLLHV